LKASARSAAQGSVRRRGRRSAVRRFGFERPDWSRRGGRDAGAREACRAGSLRAQATWSSSVLLPSYATASARRPAAGLVWQDRVMEGEVRLPEGRSGNRVWRSGGQVLRDSGPWTPTVHAFLKHLERSGFAGAPRVLGMATDGREILSYLEGETLGAGPDWRPGQPTRWPDFARSEECLVQSALLLRRLHEVSASFTPPAEAIWRQHECAALGAGEIVCHGDVGPANTVYRDGGPVAFIDFDSIRPNQPLIEFGNAAWRYVPLGDEAYFAMSDFPSAPDLSTRLALFARAYGVSDPAEVLRGLHQAKQRTVEAARYWPLTAGEGATVLRQIADDLEWLDQNAGHLLEGLADRRGA
jgi:hypothetical protein